MTYRIAQDYEYVGKDYWRWSAWVEGDDDELDSVKQVLWILHPSFKEARRVTSDRANKFRLQTAGWGIFMLRAEVELTDGKKKALRRQLRLEYPEPSTTEGPSTTESSPPMFGAASVAMPTVYLSYSTQDSRAAAKLRSGLQTAGLQVFDQTRLASGEPWSEALQRMMSQSDAVVGLVGEDDISSLVSADIQAAIASAKPTFAVITTGATSITLPRDVHILQGGVDDFDPARIVELVRSERAE
jgi:TIR domain/YEATS family